MTIRFKRFEGWMPQALLVSFLLAGCGDSPATESPPSASRPDDADSSAEISDDSLMTLVQERTFQYFWDGAEPNSGMARERYHVDGIYPQNDQHVVTSGGSGFGLMALIVGMERGFITRAEGVERL